jgi:hypothetical protein
VTPNSASSLQLRKRSTMDNNHSSSSQAHTGRGPKRESRWNLKKNQISSVSPIPSLPKLVQTKYELRLRNGFRAWVKSARPGEAQVYYIGHLAVDRGKYLTTAKPGVFDFIRTPHIDGLALEAMLMQEAGLVTLVQKPYPLPNGRVFRYIAIRTSEGYML